MLLTFKPEYARAVLDGTKTTTWRWEWARWWRWAAKGLRAEPVGNYYPPGEAYRGDGLNLLHDGVIDLKGGRDRLLQVYHRNPRNGGLRLGECVLEKLEVMAACHLTDEHARTDGFETLGAFHNAIMKTAPKGVTINHKGVLLTMGEWTEGPIDARTLPEVL